MTPLTCSYGVHDIWTNKISLWAELIFLFRLCSGTSSWNLGEFNSKLSYYDGMIQLIYSNGSQYNNKRHTQRSTHISFLCDREAGPGKPEFQVSHLLCSVRADC